MNSRPTPLPTSATDISTAPRPALAERVQDGVLVTIVLLVGIMAGAASFTHVHDWTMANSPDGTPDWFGWANAVISELIPTAALITIGRRRRTRVSYSYPMLLLVVAVAVSLTAQLAVAQRSVFGWMVSALPALAFFALSKLVFTATAVRPTHPVTAPEPATSPAASSDIERAEVHPAAATKTRATTAKKTAPAKKTTPARRTPAKKTTAPATPEPVPADPAPLPATTPAAQPVTLPAPLLANARTIATAHHHTHGEAITAGQLAVRLKVPTAIATDILTRLHTGPTTNDRPHNGTPIGAAR